jgi:ribose 5-phosphate isomerase A
MLSATEIKKLVGNYAAGLVQPGMNVGLGTGTTAYWLIQALGERIKLGLECRGIPSSAETRKLAAENGIPLVEFNEAGSIDITIDGADEIEPGLTLIKGGGGALLEEKMLAVASKKLVIIADNRKWVPVLGAFPLAVEVVPYGWKRVQQAIESEKKIICSLRLKNGKPFISDQKHYILDCFFNQIPDPQTLEGWLNSLSGVVDNGLFVKLADSAIIGYPDGNIKVISRPD